MPCFISKFILNVSSFRLESLIQHYIFTEEMIFGNGVNWMKAFCANYGVFHIWCLRKELLQSLVWIFPY